MFLGIESLPWRLHLWLHRQQPRDGFAIAGDDDFPFRFQSLLRFRPALPHVSHRDGFHAPMASMFHPPVNSTVFPRQSPIEMFVAQQVSEIHNSWQNAETLELRQSKLKDVVENLVIFD